MYPTEEYQKTFEKIESSIISCDKLEQIGVIENLITVFEKDDALPTHIEYLEDMKKNQIDYIFSLFKK